MKKLFNCKIYFISIFIIALISTFPCLVNAKVTGRCDNCHTMHNSQKGNNVLRAGTGVGWDGSNEISGGTQQESPAGNLLVTNCVGCHSSTTSQTIIDVNGSRIPIVYNTSGYPAQPLAGGNFYNVANVGDQYGHNVYGISDHDNTLLAGAPGEDSSCASSNACHFTLAAEPQSDNFNKGGCQGCHINVFHHEDNDKYRFLTGHDPGVTRYVKGKEAIDSEGKQTWEQNPSMINSNRYKGVDSFVGFSRTLAETNSISSFCGGCHADFHKAGEITNQLDNPLAGPWKRHPTDIALKSEGEYAGYDPTTTYDNNAPVAWKDPFNEAPARSDAIVMCLSCHRAHGSDQPDMLRWNYTNDCDAGSSVNPPVCGCFVCHTQKDGS